MNAKMTLTQAGRSTNAASSFAVAAVSPAQECVMAAGIRPSAHRRERLHIWVRAALSESRASDAVAEPLPRLAGRRILYVGGRSHLVPYYRVLVERRGAEFLHHDGGLEESLDAMTRGLSTVDAVVCPMDCISHAACSKVKQACKRLGKQFIPLRSSGLSSFARAIRSVA